MKDMKIKRLPAHKGAEIVAAEVTINDNIFVFCTVYRVLNLNEDNQKSTINTIKSFFKVRNPRKIVIAGDFNLNEVSWP